MAPVAVVDLGTVSAKVLVTDGVDRERSSIDVHLGGATLTPTGRLGSAPIADDALGRLGAALESFQPLIEGCRAVRVVATASTRRATNGDQVAALTRRILGVDLEIIDPETEGTLAFTGALSNPAVLGPDPDPTEWVVAIDPRRRLHRAHHGHPGRSRGLLLAAHRGLPAHLHLPRRRPTPTGGAVGRPVGGRAPHRGRPPGAAPA